ncbi:hypothetical protein CXB51_030924 [Gossypium anomalum]|uniref:Neprosin PEP catalytic domain-containing protein n=1 Tax=Gossypium anomalum TaxID=47600 RepID=A0A8J5Y3I2_9ROSI|nr:hypothetical protein CXB51_030924 [Gossypium anomalum]
MASSVSHNSFSTIPLFVGFLVVASSLAHVLSSPLMSDSGNRQMKNHTFKPAKDIQKLRRINACLKKINKPAVKTIQSPDGDIIDCFLSHLQPAFDHPELRGQKPSDPPARPKRHNSTDANPENLRTTEKDVLRASSVRRYGRTRRRHVRRDSTGSGHEHAVVFVNGDQYYGAKASLNLWAPHVTNEYEFSLSQIWIISGSFGNDLNTIEAGWQLLNHHLLHASKSNEQLHSCYFRLTHIEPLDATTCCVRAFSKPPIRLLLEQQSLQSPPTMADSLTST